MIGKNTLIWIFVFIGLAPANVFGQGVYQKMDAAFKAFVADNQLKNAIAAIHVVDAKTGAVVYSKNAKLGLLPASTQKVVTAVTAYDLLGKDFRYETQFILTGAGSDRGLAITPSGDPTLGSERFSQTSPGYIFENLIGKLKAKGINALTGKVVFKDINYDLHLIPDGWIWQDMGNYYGAAAEDFNWRENQWDLHFNTLGAKEGDVAELLNNDFEIENNVFVAAKGSGDNSICYLPVSGRRGYINGTVPLGEKDFAVSIAIPGVKQFFQNEFFSALGQGQLAVKHGPVANIGNVENIYTHYSPPLDSIAYWFLHKSINLYGEALLKTFALQNGDAAATAAGLDIVKSFWKVKGLDENELKMDDGSGLSLQNRITANAETYILKYAKTRPWFDSFLNAMPEFNGMKMKSGTIAGVKGFAGYHTSKAGEEYIFSILVNNYNGATSALVNKMYKVLNTLK